MATQTLLRKVARLESAFSKRRQSHHAALDALRQDPAAILSLVGMPPDPWQQKLLQSKTMQVLLLCSRQAGKSTIAAALALLVALLRPCSPILLLSPSLRQSGELFRKILDLFNGLGRPMEVTAESALRLELANGSRIISLPGTESTVRGYSGVAMLIIDEAAHVSDALYYSVRPMLAVSQGRLVALSTPFGKRGWFHKEWDGSGEWERVKITAPECPRIPAQFLLEERRALGDRWFRQEYMCSFEDTIDSVFSYEDIHAALSDEVEPLFAT